MYVCAALVIQHVMRMRRVIFSSVDCQTLQYIYTYNKNWKNFEKKNIIEHKMFFLHNFCLKYFILRRNEAQLSGRAV